MKIAGIFLGILFFFSLGFIFSRELNMLRSEPVNSWVVDQKADCAVVLTGGQGRVREGFDLLAQKQVNKLIISGVNPKAGLLDIFPQWPYYGDLSEKDVVLERRSTTTFGNAQQSLPIVEALRCRSVLLISSRLHMRRAYNTFRAIFPSDITIEPRAVVSGSFEPRTSQLWVEVIKSLFYSIWAY